MISRAIAQGFLEVVARHMPDGGEALLPVAGIANVVALLAPGIAREKAAAEGAGHLLLLWQVNEGRVAQEAFFFSWHGGAPLWENWGMGRMARPQFTAGARVWQTLFLPYPTGIS